ncbi:MAG TPA: pyridoxal phosphate-dependent aminotransferase [Candidatus Eisenbacteria bacterium]|jgi:aspartate/methionine/tyrosine aminotransferase
MLPISERTRELGTENAFHVLKEVLERVAAGADVKNFCIGQPDFVTPDSIRIAAFRALIEGKTGYTPSAGIPELRAAVAESMRRTRRLEVTPEDVVVGCGAKPFIGYVIQSVTDPGAGHEVVYPVPGFPIYESQIRAQGAVPVALPLRERNGFRLDPDDLEGLIGPRTRLVILNSPHNPTGSVLPRGDLEAIARVVWPFEDLWLFSDEPYSSLVFDAEFASVASLPGMAERTVVVDGVSKTYAMPGWRIGFAVNRRLAPLLARWVTNTDSCAPHLCQWAALEALTGPQQAALEMREAFRRRRDLVVQGLNAAPGVHCLEPAGAFYAWPNVTGLCESSGTADSEELRRRLLEEAGVALLSDIHFGPRVKGEGQHLRLSYAASVPDLEEGLRRLHRFARAAAPEPGVAVRA